MIFAILFIIVLVYLVAKLPLSLPIQVHILRSNNPNYNSTRTYQDVHDAIRKANNIWAQANITIDTVSIDTMNVDGSIISQAVKGEIDEIDQLNRMTQDNPTVRHVYFVGMIEYAIYGATFPAYKTVFISDHTNDNGNHNHDVARTLAHELGHTMSLLHVPNSDDLMATNGAQGINLEMWQIIASRISLLSG